MAIKQYVERSPSEQVKSDFPQPGNGAGVQSGRKYAAPDKATMGWREAPSVVQQRAIVSLEGERKSGKLHTALTAPAPIYLHSFDFGTEGVVEKFRNGKLASKTIYIAEYPQPDAIARSGKGDDVMNEAIRVYQVFRDQYYDSLAQTKAGGTVIVDTGGQAFELLTLAEFGRTERILPRSRGKINGPMAAMIRAGYGSKNVFWLHTVKDEYRDALTADGNAVMDDRGEVKSVKTGNRIHRGFGDMPFIVQMVGRCERVDLEGGGSQFQIRVKDSRHNPWANGLVIENNFDAITWALHEYMPEIAEVASEE
jgi:hypothetical protein